MKKYFIIATGMILFLVRPAANAQIGNPGLIYQAAYNNSWFLITKNAITNGMNSRSKTTPSSGTSSGKMTTHLNFTPSREIHTKVVQSMAKLMSPGDDAKLSANTDLLNKADLLGEFDKLLKKYGFDSHNLPDVFSAYILLSWQVATGNDASKNPAGIGIFRKEIHQVMDDNEELKKITDPQKQETSETLSYLAILSTLASEELTKKGDTQQLNEVRANIRQATLHISGLDVSKYTLNQTGFHSMAN